MNTYKNLLPPEPIPGHCGYYPVCSSAEWEALPLPYKVMEWNTLKDTHDHNRPRAVKAVLFDVTFMEPYGINATVSVHPEDVQKILFCNYGETDCLLFSVCGVELYGGTQLDAKWLQDQASGAFAIVTNEGYAGIQGGYSGYIPERVTQLEDGRYEYDFHKPDSKRAYYTFSNPMVHMERRNAAAEKAPLAEQIRAAEKTNPTGSGRGGLPLFCNIYIESENSIGLANRGEKGYRPSILQFGLPEENRRRVDLLNASIGVSKAQAAAMQVGPMFGWDVPGADPNRYDASGAPLKEPER